MGIFSAKKTVASITAGFASMVTDLERVESEAKAEFVKIGKEIAAKLELQKGHAKECEAAGIVKAKIRDLISPASAASADKLTK